MKKILTILVIVILAALFAKIYIEATDISWEKSDGTGSISIKTEFTITTEDCKEGVEKICNFIQSAYEKSKTIFDTSNEQTVSQNIN